MVAFLEAHHPPHHGGDTSDAPTSFEEWIALARAQMQAGTPPENFFYLAPEDRAAMAHDELALDYAAPKNTAPLRSGFDIPGSLLAIAEEVAAHKNPHRWQALYRVLWRLTHGESRLLERHLDHDMHELDEMRCAVRTDVRRVLHQIAFQSLDTALGNHLIAWVEPEHYTLPLAAPQLVRRRGNESWSLMSRNRCIHWFDHRLFESPGIEMSSSATPAQARWAALWHQHCENPCLDHLPRLKRWELTEGG